MYSGVNFLRQHGSDIHPEKNPLLRAFRKVFRLTDNYEGESSSFAATACAMPLLWHWC